MAALHKENLINIEQLLTEVGVAIYPAAKPPTLRRIIVLVYAKTVR